MFTRKIKTLRSIELEISEFHENGEKYSLMQEIPKEAKTADEKILAITTDLTQQRKGKFGTTVLFYDSSEKYRTGFNDSEHENLQSPPESYSGVSDAELAIIKASFQEYERAGNIVYLDINNPDDQKRAEELEVQIPEIPDIVIRKDNSPDLGFAASAYFPNNDPDHVQYYTIAQDLDELKNTFGEKKGPMVFLSNVLHETGHTLGMEHSFDDYQYGDKGFDDYVTTKHQSESIMDYTHSVIQSLGLTKDKLSRIDYLAIEKIYGKTLVEDSYEKYYQEQDALDAERAARRTSELNEKIDSEVEWATKELEYIQNNKDTNPILKEYLQLTTDGDLSIEDVKKLYSIVKELRESGVKSDVGINPNSIQVYEEGSHKILLNGMELEGIKPEHYEEMIALKRVPDGRTMTDYQEDMMREIVKRMGDAEITIDTDEEHQINSIKLRYLDKEYTIVDKKGFDDYGL